MDLQALNYKLLQGEIDEPGLFPHLDKLKKAPFVFQVEFGLKQLPEQPGILLIRGARQYGKSTWLEQQAYGTIQEFGPGSAFYLNGDDLPNHEALEQELIKLVESFPKRSTIRRIFIDEITTLPKWELALKKLADRGLFETILIVTTGSKATDLRRGSERLPGRKGKLSRTTYLFTPISYSEFKKQCGGLLKAKTLISYLLSGGSPIACSALATDKIIPDYAVELTRDWIEGEIALSGRNRASLFNILNSLFRFAGTPLGQAKLARESGLANNSVAAGYIEILNDLTCVTPAYPIDFDRKILLFRKECKYHFTNLLTALSYHPARIRSVDEFLQLTEQQQSVWYEWLVAQELFRRRAIKGTEALDPLAFWQSKEHEIDFVELPNEFIEVTRGKSSPLEFHWFNKLFPKQHLMVVTASQFETATMVGVGLEAFLESNN